MNKRLALIVGMVLAGCGGAPGMLPAVQPSMSLSAATTPPVHLQFAFPSPTGFGPPAVLGSPTSFGLGVALDLGPMARLSVAPQAILGRSNAHLIGFCRNHVT